MVGNTEVIGFFLCVSSQPEKTDSEGQHETIETGIHLICS